MSNMFDNITFMEHIVNVVKKYQDGEMELKAQFEEVLEGIIQRIISILSRLEEVHLILLRAERRPKNNSR
jgi:hypothetical protein